MMDCGFAGDTVSVNAHVRYSVDIVDGKYRFQYK